MNGVKNFKNHTEFLIVDGDEKEFRKNFENQINDFLPVILVLVQGGYHELEDVLNAIHRKISVLVIAVRYLYSKLFVLISFLNFRILEGVLVF